jgi:capsular exopolysaccharide synthesis family protein
MSRIYEGLSRLSVQRTQFDLASADRVPAGMILPESATTPEAARDFRPETIGSAGTAEPQKPLEIDKIRSVTIQPAPRSRLVAWSDPNSLGAEKFRALAVRLDAMRKQRELNSLQVTSSVINEGKSFVAANLGVTLAKYSGSRTLLIEGDLHRPTVASMLGLKELKGISDWWSGRDQDIAHFIVRIDGTGLWFLPAGRVHDRPSEILHSARLAEAFVQLASRFDWIIVDSTPMLPVIDTNLWSRLVDGTLLVIREGVAPIKALKNGLQSLDHPKLIGVVINEASEFDQANYDGNYYDGGPRARMR